MKSFLAVLLACVPLAAAAAPPASGGTLARIKSAQAINVAYSPDSLPFSFVEAGKEPRGYSIDLCRRVIAQVGRVVGVANLKVNWIAGSTPQRLEMVAAGKADLECANTTQTLGRMASVDFSSLIFLESASFIARKDSAVQRLADVAGKKVVVLKGTTNEKRLREVLQKRLINAEVIAVDKPADGMAMLEGGRADLFAGDRIKLIGLVSQAKEPGRFAMLAEDFSYEPYAMALPRNDTAFRLEVNRALSQVYASGEIESIFGPWLGALGRPSQMLLAMYVLNATPE